MANIGATTAFYKVETSLTRANNEVSKSMERLATGKANANAGDRASYVAMADTFRLDFVGTKAGIKGASVAMGYLETGMRVLDSASALLSRLQELAVLGANDTNTTADHEAINLEAEAIADEFNRLMTTSTYKGKDAFVAVASSQYVSMGGRDQEMTFGIGTIDYSALYASARTIVDGPNDTQEFNLAHLPSDAVVAKEYGVSPSKGDLEDTSLAESATYVLKSIGVDGDGAATGNAYLTADDEANDILLEATRLNETSITHDADDGTVEQTGLGNMTLGDVITMDDTIADDALTIANHEFALVNTGDNAFIAGDEFEIVSLGDSDGDASTTGSDAWALAGASDDIAADAELAVGTKFTIKADATSTDLARINALTEGMTFRRSSDTLTKDIEAIQALINTARVQAGSQYAAMESAVNYTTDLTAQYELGYNTVNDVNFSMETAHLAKNQILQQAATAMLAQANQGQQGLLQLIA